MTVIITGKSKFLYTIVLQQKGSNEYHSKI